jgi:hypothetical protein
MSLYFVWGLLSTALAENMVVMLGCCFSEFLDFTIVANVCENNSFYTGNIGSFFGRFS